MVYLAHGAAWSLFGTALSWTIALATTLAFANLISKETYGTYQYVLSIADLFGIFVLVGVDAALARSVARGKEGSLYDALKTKIRWGLVGGAGSVLLGIYYFVAGNTMLGSAFLLTGALIPFWEAPGLYITYLQGKKKFAFNNLYDVGAQFFAALAIIPALYFSKDLLVILAAYLVSWGVARCFFFYLTIKQFPPNAETDPEMVPYGKHLTAMTAMTTISSQADTVILWQLLGPAAIAVYVFAQALPVRAASIIKIVNRVAFPKMATQEHETLQKTLLPKVLILCFFAALVALAYAACAPFLFSLFFPKYLDAVPYTQLASLLIVFQPFSLITSSLTAQSKQKTLYIYNVIIPILRISLFLVLIPPFHLLGAVGSLVAVKVLESALLVYLFRRP